MATWEAKKAFKFQSMHSSYPKGTSDYFTWSYQTTADSLRIVRHQVKQSCAYGCAEYPPKTDNEFFEPDEAQALYLCLRDWIRRYRGEPTLERLDKMEVADELPDAHREPQN